jgi:hypothetical protein
MFRGDWRKHRHVIKLTAISAWLLTGAIITYACGVAIGSKLGYYEAQSDGYAAQYPSETDKRVAHCFDSGVTPSAKECAQEAIEASRDSQRSESDLGAQREMAKWAFWLLALTVVQSFIGLGGFVALIVTIRQGRKANRISEKTAKRELRAYIVVTPGDVTVVAQDEVKAAISVKNEGATPAKFVDTKGQITIADKGPFWLPRWKERKRERDMSLAPRQDITITQNGNLCLLPDTIQKLKDDELALVVHGTVFYEDVFGNERHTNFCYAYSKGKYKAADGNIAERGNDAS